MIEGMKKYMTHKNILIAAAVIIVIALLVFAAFSVQRSQGALSVVYMATGEVYIGELATFPRFVIRNGYQFQTGVDPQDPSKTTSQLIPISDAVWAPKELHINRNQVIFHGPLTESSQLLDAINKAETSEDSEK